MTETLNTLRTAEQAYADACQKRDAAWKLYDMAIDAPYNEKTYRKNIEAACEKARALDNQASVMWYALESAKVAHLEYLESQEQDCDCTPISTCEPCAKRARNQEIQF